MCGPRGCPPGPWFPHWREQCLAQRRPGWRQSEEGPSEDTSGALVGEVEDTEKHSRPQRASPHLPNSVPVFGAPGPAWGEQRCFHRPSWPEAGPKGAVLCAVQTTALGAPSWCRWTSPLPARWRGPFAPEPAGRCSLTRFQGGAPAGMPSFGPGKCIPLGPEEKWKSRAPPDPSPPHRLLQEGLVSAPGDPVMGPWLWERDSVRSGPETPVTPKVTTKEEGSSEALTPRLPHLCLKGCISS